MAALDAWRGALLLEAVGMGKTWIALAVAAHESAPVVAIVPAILRTQWANAARRAQVPLHLCTHERASRSSVPDVDASLVIIDEAHRFRDAGTRRVQAIAPWLAGRRVLLLTATPIVNRLGDLVTLLRLALPEDALALDGIARLGDLEQRATPPAALRRVAVRNPPNAIVTAGRLVSILASDDMEDGRGERSVAAIAELKLSDLVPVRRLIASVLLDAAASSDAAFHQVLRRYRALLLQARDAGGASRAMLRRFAGESLDQMVFWPLLAVEEASELPLVDIGRVERLLTVAPDDRHWIGALINCSADARPTIWFTRHRATARELRLAAGDETAWITGVEAGIGPHRMSRDTILAAFGRDRSSWRARSRVPRILVATDVAAEGLDLYAAGRIVHVDLPWTATRLEQREGRLHRLGQQHANVEVIMRVPSVAIEKALAPRARIHRKRRIAVEWLNALEAEDPAPVKSMPESLVIHFTSSEIDATVVAVRLERGGRSGLALLTRAGSDEWRLDDPVAAQLMQEHKDRRRNPPRLRRGPPAVESTPDEFTGAIRTAIAHSVSGDAAPRVLVSRILRMARRAASYRDGPALQRLDRLLRFATASPTLGARMILARLDDANDRDLLRCTVPDLPPRGAVRATITAAIVSRRD